MLDVNTNLDIQIKDNDAFDVLDRILSLDGSSGVRMNAIAAAAAAEEVAKDYSARWLLHPDWYKQDGWYQNWKKGMGLEPGTLTGTTEHAISSAVIRGGGLVYLKGTWPQFGIFTKEYHETSQMQDVVTRDKNAAVTDFGSVQDFLEAAGYSEGQIPLQTKHYGEWRRKYGTEIDFMYLEENNISAIMGYMDIFLQREIFEGTVDSRIQQLLKEDMAQSAAQDGEDLGLDKDTVLAMYHGLKSGRGAGDRDPQEIAIAIERLEKILRGKKWL